jgi:hypothetical protein
LPLFVVVAENAANTPSAATAPKVPSVISVNSILRVPVIDELSSLGARIKILQEGAFDAGDRPRSPGL